VEKKLGRSPRDLWAYAYLIIAPQSENQLDVIRMMVDKENSDAEGGPRIWAGRMVLEKRLTHILIVCDSPEQNRKINLLLEAELRRMQAEFFLTEAMTIPGYPDATDEPHAHGGNGRAPILPPKTNA
jgi:hypothetical protein